MKKSGALYAKVKKQPWKRQANQTNAWNKKYMCISSNYGYKSFDLKPEYLWCLCPLHIWKLKKTLHWFDNSAINHQDTMPSHFQKWSKNKYSNSKYVKIT